MILPRKQWRRSRVRLSHRNHQAVLSFSFSTASATFFSYSLFASNQTRAFSLLGNSNKDGRRSVLNCSDASLGSRVGRWSIEMTCNGGLPTLARTMHEDRWISLYGVLDSLDVRGDRRLEECRVRRIYGNWVVWVRRVAAYIHDDA